MKRVFAISLVLALAILPACGKKDEKKTDKAATATPVSGSPSPRASAA